MIETLLGLLLSDLSIEQLQLSMYSIMLVTCRLGSQHDTVSCSYMYCNSGLFILLALKISFSYKSVHSQPIPWLIIINNIVIKYTSKTYMCSTGSHAWLCPHQRVLQNTHDAWRFKTYRRGALTWTSNAEMLLIFYLLCVACLYTCIYKFQLVVVLFLLSIIPAEILWDFTFNVLYIFFCLIPSF